MYEYIEDNLKSVNERIAEAASKGGRDPAEITLVAISKTFPPEAVKAAVKYGARHLGESRIQDAEPKIKELGDIAVWHMVGHLQTNKVKNAVKLFPIIQSVDSIKVAEEIEKRAGKLNKKIDCLIEINSSGEKAKYGFVPENTIEAIDQIKGFGFVKLRGIMTIGPHVENEKEIRKAFADTRNLFEQAKKIIGEDFDTLSMGMSGDFETAIDEGSNMVRIGTAIFGPRKR